MGFKGSYWKLSTHGVLGSGTKLVSESGSGRKWEAGSATPTALAGSAVASPAPRAAGGQEVGQPVPRTEERSSVHAGAHSGSYAIPVGRVSGHSRNLNFRRTSNFLIQVCSTCDTGTYLYGKITLLSCC